MALLIYKQWHRISITKTGCAAGSNAAHIQYIGERVHVMKDENNPNGLFGKIGGMFNVNYDMKALQNYVAKITRENKTVFRSCISLTPERAKALGLEKKGNWEKFVKYHSADIAEKNGIKINNFEYVAAVHDKKGQPHVHICFWDKNQEVAKINVDAKLCDDVRKTIEQKEFSAAKSELEFNIGKEFEDEDYDFGEEYEVDNGDEVRTKLIDRVFAKEKLCYEKLQDMTLMELKEMSEDTLGKLLNGLLSEKTELLDEFDKLDMIIPRQGKMFFNEAHMIPYRQQITAFVNLLIKNVPVLTTLENEFISAGRLLAEMYHSNEWEITKHMYSKKDKHDTDLANKVLRAMLANRREHLSIHNRTDKQRREAEKFHLSNAITAIFRVIRDFSNDANASLQASSAEIFGRGDLSKEQIKNLLAQLDDRGNER